MGNTQQNMGWNYNADEVFEMAEHIEENGVQFYLAAAENAGDKDVKTFLLELAEMERDHQRIFASIRKKLLGDDTGYIGAEPFDESAAYLKILADTRVFFEKKIDVSSLEEVLKAAILAEKDSIVFYIGLKDLVPEDLGRDKVDVIIKEEMGHINMLSRRLLKFKPAGA